jgi:hypothetical protein
VFELVTDIRTVVHEEWFDFNDYTYEYDTSHPNYAPTPKKEKISGYIITPKIKL